MEEISRGNLSWKISCWEAISRNSGNQDLREVREKVNRYMEKIIDKVKSQRMFDLSTTIGIRHFRTYLVGELHLMDVNFERSSIKVIVKCGTPEILEDLWHDYCCGHLNEVAEECLITEQVKEELGMETIKLKTTILEEDYVACKLSLMENPGNVDLGRNTQNMAIPLCLPNNCQWSVATGEYIKTGGRRSSLYVVEDALQKLRTIKGPVCVVSIAGPNRKGKSYILSKVFGQSDVFPVGHRMDPETIGIWMWVVPQKMRDSNGQECTVVLLDSEGIDAGIGEGLDDNQIFTLTVLLASVLIYNSQGVPTRRDLEGLDVIEKLSQRIDFRSRSGGRSMRGHHEDTELFHKTFPFFIWLLRDVSLSLPPDCKDLTEYFLTWVFKGSSLVDLNRRVAESILRFFPGFHAFDLPSPTYDPEVLADIRRHESLLNPKFLSKIEKFKELLQTTLIPKHSFNNGEIVTGEGLGALVQRYVEAINTPGVIPNVQRAWETFVATKCSEAAKTALKAYHKIMTSRLAGQLPCDNEKIRKSHEAALEQGIAQLEADTTGISAVTTEKYLRELTEALDKKLASWQSENERLTIESCTSLLKQLKKEHLDPVLAQLRGQGGVKVMPEDIVAGYNKIEHDYKARATGAKDVCAAVFFEFHPELMNEVQQYLGVLRQLKDLNAAKANEERKRTRVEEENARLKQEIRERRMEMEMLQSKQQEEIKRLREQMEAEAKAQRDQMDNMTKASMEHAKIMQENQALKWLHLEIQKSNEGWQQRMENLNQRLQQHHRFLVTFKQGKPGDGDLDELAGKIAAKWQELGLRLGLSQEILDEIDANKERKAYWMLLHWRNTTASAALYHDLYHALCHDRVGLNSVAKEFCGKKIA